ncbi:MAG TPA: RecX family transcriptional regulator, partial [Phycisphaerales bacterium]|nr:RecX family transcriptional regulator [Phycisphaerales bacterium]
MARRRAARFEVPELPLAGGVITAVVRAADEPDVLAIRIGRKTAGRVHERRAAELGIGEGVEWTERMRREVGAGMRDAAAREWAVSAVARRGMSRSMLVGKLVQRGLERGAAARIAEELSARGLIDERAFAEGVVASTLARKGAGKRLLLNRVRAKGVDARTAGDVVEKVTGESGYDAMEAALELAGRKLRVMGERLDGQATRRRLQGLLARRGVEV